MPHKKALDFTCIFYPIIRALYFTATEVLQKVKERLKKKNHLIISIDVKETLCKIQNSLRIFKTLSKFIL